MKVKEESEKVGLKLNTQKMKIMASCPITSWEIDGLNNSSAVLDLQPNLRTTGWWKEMSHSHKLWHWQHKNYAI